MPTESSTNTHITSVDLSGNIVAPKIELRDLIRAEICHALEGEKEGPADIVEHSLIYIVTEMVFSSLLAAVVAYMSLRFTRNHFSLTEKRSFLYSGISLVDFGGGHQLAKYHGDPLPQEFRKIFGESGAPVIHKMVQEILGEQKAVAHISSNIAFLRQAENRLGEITLTSTGGYTILEPGIDLEIPGFESEDLERLEALNPGIVSYLARVSSWCLPIQEDPCAWKLIIKFVQSLYQQNNAELERLPSEDIAILRKVVVPMVEPPHQSVSDQNTMIHALRLVEFNHDDIETVFQALRTDGLKLYRDDRSKYPLYIIGESGGNGGIERRIYLENEFMLQRLFVMAVFYPVRDDYEACRVIRRTK